MHSYDDLFPNELSEEKEKTPNVLTANGDYRLGTRVCFHIPRGEKIARCPLDGVGVIVDIVFTVAEPRERFYLIQIKEGITVSIPTKFCTLMGW